MRSVTIATVADTGHEITVTGTSRQRTTITPFRVDFKRNDSETGAMAIHRGSVINAEGLTENAGKGLLSHLAATDQLKPGVVVVI